MKLKPIVLILVILTIHINLIAQDNILNKKISIELNNISLKEALKKIENKYSIYFSYQEGLFPSQEKIDYKFKNTTLQNALNTIFSKYNFNFIEVNNGVIIKAKSEQLKVIIEEGNKKNNERDTSELLNDIKSKEYPQIDLNKPKVYNIEDIKRDTQILVTPGSIKKKKLNTGILLFPLIAIPPDSLKYSIGFNGGMLLDYEIANSFSISTGLCFSSHKAIDTTASIKHDSIITKRQIHYILPIKFRYSKNINLNKIYISSGIINYLFSNNALFTEKNVSASKIFYGNYFNISVGYEYFIKESISLQIEPDLRIPIYNSNNVFDLFPYFGIGIRLNYYW